MPSEDCPTMTICKASQSKKVEVGKEKRQMKLLWSGAESLEVPWRAADKNHVFGDSNLFHNEFSIFVFSLYYSNYYSFTIDFCRLIKSNRIFIAMVPTLYIKKCREVSQTAQILYSFGISFFPFSLSFPCKFCLFLILYEC
jgi:hypothetical protein